MIKRLVIVAFIGLFVATGAFGSGFSKKGKSGGISVEYSSPKPLVVGNNDMKIVLKKGAEPIEGAKVSMKVFMPEMPGMPYMEYVDSAKEVGDGVYEVMMNFSMGGTWQVRIEIEHKDKKNLFRSSVIL